MARSGNRRRRAGSTSFHSQSNNPHDDADFANQNENYNGSSDHSRHKHGIAMSNGVGKPAPRQAADDQSRRKDGNDRPRSDRRHQNGHHLPSVQQRWEGKEASVNDREDGKASRFQDYALYLASRAKELKEEGNRRFQRKDYAGAMEQYELALQLIDQGHPDRAILHSNRAACLMQMKPPNYEEAVRECGLALDVHPGFGRALLRRARAYEAQGKFSLALDDVQRLLHNDGNHPDAVEMEARIRGLLREHGDEKSSQQDLRGKSSLFRLMFQLVLFSSTLTLRSCPFHDESMGNDSVMNPWTTTIGRGSFHAQMVDVLLRSGHGSSFCEENM